MPELPEAQTIARRLHEALAGLTVREVELRRRDMLKTGPRRALRAWTGQRLARVDTRGKYVVLHAEHGRLVVQLGMAGRVRIVPPGQSPEPHTHLQMVFEGAREVHYSNVRRIASGIHCLPPGDGDDGPLAVLGPEATTIPLPAFVEAMRGRRRPIKAALLDQSLLAGLGNIYTDESLGRAGIHPLRHACDLSADEMARLHCAVRHVLAEAIAAGGSSLDDANPFVDADGQLGYFAAEHRVYGRYGQPCRACAEELLRATIGGRTSTYCPRCQR